MTLNGVFCVILPNSVDFEADYVKVVEDNPYSATKVCPKNLVFSDRPIYIQGGSEK